MVPIFYLEKQCFFHSSSLLYNILLTQNTISFFLTGPQWAISVILLLEFALVSGNDWWDLLVSTPPSSIHTLTDRLTDTFLLHSPPIIQHLHTRFLVMKTSMLRFVRDVGFLSFFSFFLYFFGFFPSYVLSL